MSIIGNGIFDVCGDITYHRGGRSLVIGDPEVKKVFLQLGKSFHLSDDIVNILYNILKGFYNGELEDNRFYHKLCLLHNVMDTPYDLDDIIIHKKNPFSFRIPLNRGCEWAIKHSPNRKMYFDEENTFSKYRDIREKLFFEINILGEENYLLYSDFKKNRIVPADRKLKLSYLNKSPFEEVHLDYLNYLEWKDTPHENSWTLMLDDYGEGQFLPNN